MLFVLLLLFSVTFSSLELWVTQLQHFQRCSWLWWPKCFMCIGIFLKGNFLILMGSILKCYELHSSKKHVYHVLTRIFGFRTPPHLSENSSLGGPGEKFYLPFRNVYFLNCPPLNFQISLLGMGTCTFPGTTLHNDYHFIERVISKWRFFYRLEKRVQA